MGAINKFDIGRLISEKQIKNYLETGLGEGMCMSHMLQFQLDRRISVEIHPELYKLGKLKFPNEEILLGNSYEVLQNIFPTLNGNTLFFLDAHFPGADFHFNTYAECANDGSKLPLEEELLLLAKYRSNCNDVIIIDDLRIYMDGPYTDGNWKDRGKLGSSKPGFIFDILTQMNFNININYQDQGYVIGYKS